MGLYPYNHNYPHRMQTDVPGLTAARGGVVHLDLTAEQAVAASADGVLAATELADGETTTVDEDLGALPCVRNLSVKGNAATAAGNVVINGTDFSGQAITETIVANGTATVEGAKAFQTVTSIVLPARGAASDTLQVGWGNKLGLPYKLSRNTLLGTYLNDVKESSNTVTVSATTISANTVKLNSALNGKAVRVSLMV